MFCLTGLKLKDGLDFWFDNKMSGSMREISTFQNIHKISYIFHGKIIATAIIFDVKITKFFKYLYFFINFINFI